MLNSLRNLCNLLQGDLKFQTNHFQIIQFVFNKYLDCPGKSCLIRGKQQRKNNALMQPLFLVQIIERKTSPTRPAQSRRMCFSTSAAAHVQLRSHVFLLSEQGRIKPQCPPLQLPLHPGDKPQHRGPTGDGALLLICQAGCRVNKSHVEGDSTTSRIGCVAAVTLHSDAAVLHCIYKVQIVLHKS